MPDVARITKVEYQHGIGADLARLPQHVVDEVYERMKKYVGQDHPVGQHVHYFTIDSHAVRLNVFADADGTLWIQSAGTT